MDDDLDSIDYKICLVDNGEEKREVATIPVEFMHKNRKIKDIKNQRLLRIRILELMQAAKAHFEEGNSEELNKVLIELGHSLPHQVDDIDVLISDFEFTDLLISMLQSNVPEIMANVLFCLSNLLSLPIPEITEQFATKECIKFLCSKAQEEDPNLAFHAYIALANLMDSIDSSLRHVTLKHLSYQELFTRASLPESDPRWCTVAMAVIFGAVNYLHAKPEPMEVANFILYIFERNYHTQIMPNISKTMYVCVATNRSYAVAFFQVGLYQLIGNSINIDDPFPPLALFKLSLQAFRSIDAVDDHPIRLLIAASIDIVDLKKCICDLGSTLSRGIGFEIGKTRVKYDPEILIHSSGQFILDEALNAVNEGAFSDRLPALMFIKASIKYGAEEIISKLLSENITEILVNALNWEYDKIVECSLTSIRSLIDRTKETVLHQEVMDSLVDEGLVSAINALLEGDLSMKMTSIAESVREYADGDVE